MLDWMEEGSLRRSAYGEDRPEHPDGLGCRERESQSAFELVSDFRR